jgi:hypothetical protein
MIVSGQEGGASGGPSSSSSSSSSSSDGGGFGGGEEVSVGVEGDMESLPLVGGSGGIMPMDSTGA